MLFKKLVFAKKGLKRFIIVYGGLFELLDKTVQ